MEDIKKRFIEVYEYLISQNLIRDKKDFAQKLDVSTSLLTEIWKSRTNIGTKVIQNTVLKFNISGDWLLTGEGDMLRSEGEVEKKADNSKEIERLERMIDSMQQQIDSLIAQNKLLIEQNKSLTEQLQQFAHLISKLTEQLTQEKNKNCQQ